MLDNKELQMILVLLSGMTNEKVNEVTPGDGRTHTDVHTQTYAHRRLHTDGCTQRQTYTQKGITQAVIRVETFYSIHCLLLFISVLLGDFLH